MAHGVAYWLGLTDASGGPYLFWSGIFGDAGLVAGAAVLLRKHNCHREWCWRVGFHPQADGKIHCNKHREV